MVVNQGDIFWIDPPYEPTGSAPGYRRPHVIIQNDLFNYSRINTVVVCAITSNLKYAKFPGNVLLAKGEANLPESSVVNVTQILTVDKSELLEKIGTLSPKRVYQVVDGVCRVLEPRQIKV